MVGVHRGGKRQRDWGWDVEGTRRIIARDDCVEGGAVRGTEDVGRIVMEQTSRLTCLRILFEVPGIRYPGLCVYPL